MSNRSDSSQGSGFKVTTPEGDTDKAVPAPIKSLDQLGKETVTLDKLGDQLPVGVFLNGERLRDYEVEPYTGELDRKIGIWSNNTKSSLSKLLARVLNSQVKSIGGHSIESLSKQLGTGKNTLQFFDNMWFGDCLCMFLNMRIKGVGPSLKMSAQCPECRYVTEDNPDMGRDYHDLSLTDVDAYSTLSAPPEIQLELPNGIKYSSETIKLVNMQPMKLYQVDTITNPADKRPTDIKMMYKMISTLPDSDLFGKAKGEVFSDELYGRLTPRDLMKLRSVVGDFQPGPRLIADMVCARCDAEWEAAVPWTEMRTFLFQSPEFDEN